MSTHDNGATARREAEQPVQREPLSDDEREQAAMYRWLRDEGSPTWSPFQRQWRMDAAGCDSAIRREMQRLRTIAERTAGITQEQKP